MCAKFDILEEIYTKYEEHIEMQGEQSPALVIRILVSLLYEERNKTEYYERLLKHRAKS